MSHGCYITVWLSRNPLKLSDRNDHTAPTGDRIFSRCSAGEIDQDTATLGIAEVYRDNVAAVVHGEPNNVVAVSKHQESSTSFRSEKVTINLPGAILPKVPSVRDRKSVV